MHRMRTSLIFFLLCELHGQTMVDLGRQTRNVDFTAAISTKPFKSGTTLPATCSVGEMFFKSNAPAGTNLYACTSLNSWSAQTGVQGPPGPAGANGTISKVFNAGAALPVEPVLNFVGGGCTDDPADGRTNCSSSSGGSMSVGLAGVVIGMRPTLNFTNTGTGITQACADNAGANRVDCTLSMNTAAIPTHSTIHANENFPTLTSAGVTALTFTSADAAITAYAKGMCFDFYTDTANPVSINIDGLGPKAITLHDGAMPVPAGIVNAGRYFHACYDGSVFRFEVAVPGPAPVLTSTSGPVADPGGPSAYLYNNASGAITYNLPAGVAGYQRCYRNATGKSGSITVAVATSNSIDLNGLNGTTSTGTLVSGGALGDAVCLVSDTTNHWYAYVQKGSWTNN